VVSSSGFGVVGSYQCNGVEDLVDSRTGKHDGSSTSYTVDASEHHGAGPANALGEYDGSGASYTVVASEHHGSGSANAMGEYNGSGASYTLEVAATR
jgi:hypothetical protein